MTRIVCISDTHGIHKKIPPLPKGDILIHAGDFTGWGTYSEIEQFAEWLYAKDFAQKIVIAGNHDEEAQDTVGMKILFGNYGVIYLKDSYCFWSDDDGRILKVYGTPYTPEFCGWHFMEYEHELRARYAKIPDDTNILITHGPPANILDQSGITTRYEWNPITLSEKRIRENNRAGSTALAMRIQQLPALKLNVFGHIHAGRGVLRQDDVCYVNASCLGEDYEPVQEDAIVIDL